MRARLHLLFIPALFFNLISCEKEVSKNNSQSSHHAGLNCMECHNSGEHKFNTAGTVFDTSKVTPLANAIIKLYSEPIEGGKLLETIEVDAYGNFYSPHRINYSKTVYPTVISPSGHKSNMVTGTTSGACNSCHGVTEQPIWIQ
ncbi:MAG: hypothetical protein R2780_02375 [Crocinitomicaceae bacterium]|nr:hypothetical protein [Crocinitomicaceae bacterium]